MRRLAFFYLIILACCGFSQERDPLSVVKAYISAQHNRDVEAEMALCRPDIVFTITGAFQCEGTEQIRGIFEWDAELNAKLEFDYLKVEGSTVSCSGVENNDWFKAVGIEVVKYDRIAFTVEDGKIKSIAADASAETSSEVSRVMVRLMPWLQERHPEMMDELFQGSEFNYSAESARRWRALLKEWNLGKDTQ